MGESIYQKGQQTPQEAFFQRLQQQGIDNPPQGERVIGAFNTSFYNAAATIDAVGNLATRYIAEEPVDNTSYRVRKLFKSTQALCMTPGMRLFRDYPERYDSLEPWDEFIEGRLGDERSFEYQKLQNILSKETLQTNRYTRMVVVAAALAIQRYRYPLHRDNIVHEIGTSNGHVLKALMNPPQLSLEVVEQDETQDPILTRMYNMAIALTPHVEQAIGIDIHPPKTDEELMLLKSSTLDPSQLDKDNPYGAGHEEMFDSFTTLTPEGVSILRGDIMNLSRRVYQRLQKNKANVVFLSHLFDQNPSRVREIVSKVLPHVEKGGLFVANGYARVHPDRPDELLVLDDWYDKRWLCQTLVLDTQRLDQGFIPIFEWETGRCERVKVFLENINRIIKNSRYRAAS